MYDIASSSFLSPFPFSNSSTCTLPWPHLPAGGADSSLWPVRRCISRGTCKASVAAHLFLCCPQCFPHAPPPRHALSHKLSDWKAAETPLCVSSPARMTKGNLYYSDFPSCPICPVVIEGLAGMCNVCKERGGGVRWSLSVLCNNKLLHREEWPRGYK